MIRRSVEQLTAPLKPLLPNKFRLSDQKDRLFIFALWKARRKEHAPQTCTSPIVPDEDTAGATGDKRSQPSSDKQYLRNEFCQLISLNDSHYGNLFNRGLAGLEELCRLPPGVNYNEWVISHECSFFTNISLVYDGLREFCSTSSCPSLSGYGNQQICHWIDERGRKFKCTALQHMDLALGYADRMLSAPGGEEELSVSSNTSLSFSSMASSAISGTIWKTENVPNGSARGYYESLPMSNVETARRVVRSMLKVLLHLYYAHFDRAVQTRLHKHMNSVFLHFMVFNLHFKLLDVKDSDQLNGLFHRLLNQATKAVLPSPETTDNETPA